MAPNGSIYDDPIRGDLYNTKSGFCQTENQYSNEAHLMILMVCSLEVAEKMAAGQAIKMYDELRLVDEAEFAWNGGSHTMFLQDLQG